MIRSVCVSALSVRAVVLAVVLAVVPAAAQNVFEQVSARYDYDAVAGQEFSDAIVSTDLGDQGFSINDSLFGRYAVTSSGTSGFSADTRITLTTTMTAITRGNSLDLVTANSEATVVFDLLVGSRVTMRAFNIGWRATTNNNGQASCSTVLDGPSGRVYDRQAPMGPTSEFFEQSFILPPGRYTWSLFASAGSDNDPTIPMAQNSGGAHAVLDLRFEPGTFGCNAADLADPLGLLDLADISAFVAGFTGDDLIADLDENGLLDLADITLFVSAFTAGCP